MGPCTKLRLHDTQLAMIQAGSSELKRKARLLKVSVLLLGARRLLWQQASSWEDTMADSVSPPPKDGPAPRPAPQIPPPPPYQPDPKLITYIERDQRPQRDQHQR